MAKLMTLEGFNRNVTVEIKQIYHDPLIGLKKYADATTGLGAGLDHNGFPETGLTEDHTDENGKLVKGTRTALEQELDLAPGTLKNTNVAYWASYFVRIGSDPVKLNLQDPVDLQKYLFALAQSNVCDGQMNIGKDSRYEFVIYSKEQEAALKVKGRSALKEAYKLSDDLDLETKINILSVYGEIADATAPNTIIDKIDEKIETNPEKFLKIAKDPNLIAKSLIRKALDKGVLHIKEADGKIPGGVYYKEAIVGFDQDRSAEVLMKDKTLEAILKAELSGDLELLERVLSKGSKDPVKQD